MVSLALVTPALLWATLLLVAVSADAPWLAATLVTAPLAGASLLGLIAAASAGTDTRRTRVGTRVRPARSGVALAVVVALTLTVAAPAVAAALPPPSTGGTLPGDTAPPERMIEFGSHDGHDSGNQLGHSGHSGHTD